MKGLEKHLTDEPNTREDSQKEDERNRVIKFRAWDGNKMIYNVSVNAGVDWSLRHDSPTGNALMQFTGLLDKNGTEIYEGDILDFYYPLGEDDYGVINHTLINVKISFESGAFWFTGDGYTDCNWHFYNASDREVISHIYLKKTI